MQISQQLSNITTTTGSAISAPFSSPARSRAPTSVIVVNILWFSSLILSLISASIGILVRQWLQEYCALTSSQPYESICIRQYRYNNYMRWQVDILLKMLPFLLQLALLLFFTGIPIFLWSADPLVARFVTTLIVAWLVCWLFAITLPALFSGCPYKSAEASVLFTLVRRIKEVNPYVVPRLHLGKLARPLNVRFWVRHTMRLLNTLRIRIRSTLHCFVSEHRTIHSAKSLPSTWHADEAEIAAKMRDTLGLGVLERALDVLFDKMILVNATRAYLQEKGVKSRDMADFVYAQMPRVFGFDKKDLWGWLPDSSHSTCAWMKFCVDIVARKDFHPEPWDDMVSILANYASLRRSDAPDQQVIQGIHDILRGLPKDRFISQTCDSGLFQTDELGER